MTKRRFTKKRTQGGDSSPVIVNVNSNPEEHSAQNKSPQTRSVTSLPAELVVEGVPPSDQPDVYIFPSERISTQPNADINYQEVGIIHVTESSAINMARNLVTNVYNAVGAQGFDNTIFDSARNQALEKMNQQLTEEHKVSNLRMEVTNDPTLVFIHLYGTLLKRIEAPVEEAPVEEAPVEETPTTVETTPTTVETTPTTVGTTPTTVETTPTTVGTTPMSTGTPASQMNETVPTSVPVQK